MGKFYLLKYADNWADEMDLDGHYVMSESQRNLLLLTIKALENETFCFYVGFGTNQEIEYQTVDDIENAFIIEEITYTQAQMLKALGLSSGGFAEHFYDYMVEVGGQIALGEEL